MLTANPTVGAVPDPASRPETPLGGALLPPELQAHETWAEFAGGLRVHFRPILPADAPLLRELFHSHSPETILHRYFILLRELTPVQLHNFVDLDYRRDFALVGLIPAGRREQMICVGRYFRHAFANEAEIAITVHDSYQRRGLGTYLCRRLVEIARAQGLVAFTADVLVDNHAMMHVFHKVTGKIQARLEIGAYHVRIDLTTPRTPATGPASPVSHEKQP
jgi:GNAT superfamily N-acetyltransferase